MVQQQQQLRSLADEYALKPGSVPRSPPPPTPPASLQIVASGVAEEPKQEAGHGNVNNRGERISEEVKLILGDDVEGEKLQEEQVDGNGVEGEEEECGFCLFMKGGGCRENFIAWEKCMEEAEKNDEDLVEKCYEVTGSLMKCMEAHADYYEPILRAEKAVKEQVAQELERDRESMTDVTATTATE